MAQGRVTAFQLDPDVAAATDGVVFPGFPGVWQPDVAYLPDALGMSVGDLRDKIVALGLPLVEVKVSERSARKSFAERPNHLPSGPSVPHEAAAGPGFGLVDDTVRVDPTVLDRRADVMDIMDEQGVAPGEAERILSEEQAEAEHGDS